MTTATDRVEIQRLLDRYRRFQECLLRGLRLEQHGLRLVLEFDYIWDRTADDVWQVVAEPSPVVVSLDPVEQASIVLNMPVGIVEDPSQADWGLSEVAMVRLEEAPAPPPGISVTAQRHKLTVVWERDQWIEVVFRRLRLTDAFADPADEDT